ncbi:NRAMP family divalent metal transporter [Methylovirgula sp. HY1]|uniref:NRAMP family divalent metal transporter n=1 Tax=Methylovirgula sp. HY1 TaxID=2822761 RepID=UPI001C5B9089|nr:divalent metal cation transporter [Methylovirgula sp. HY1]QXX74295.1 Divalent metal cation transporter MntH [Methylovirgula sp. HY1]
MSTQKHSNNENLFRRFLNILGPGLITGAADDDPSGIATYSQTGAQFGYGQLWIAVFTLPLMTAIQEACARIGLVTGKGIVAVVKERYGMKMTVGVVLLVLVANTINIGADIGAMAAAAQLVAPVSFVVATLGFTTIILVLEIFTSYRVYAKILKWLALSLLSYVVTVFIVNEPWLTLLRATFVPHIEFNFAFLFIITGVIGTTISPYMFIWEASEEVEDARERHLLRGGKRPKLGWSDIRRMRLDNFIGMLSSNVVSWCIIVTTATVLHGNGITNIATSADAAKAIEPLVHSFPHAGHVAKVIFAVGVIGLGLLAVPVLSGSASYAVAEAFNWRASLAYKLNRAHGFYGVITIATLVGLLINFVGIDPIKALIVTAVINGVVAVPLIFLVARIADNSEIMGEYKSGRLSNIFLWITFLFVGAAAVGMFATYFTK